jgi:predicted acylesterase/phospholipase RssA
VSTEQSPVPRFTYPKDPGRRCDIVLKGGITSGVVYPHAICRLAENFRLQQIGGTSAGAIAAAGAAAAEYGRRRGEGEGYRALETLPKWLGETPAESEDSNLFHFFQPAQSTRGLFALLIAAISHPKSTVAFEILMSALANWRRAAVLGALPGLGVFALLFLSLADEGGFLAGLALVAGTLASLTLALLGALAFVGVALYFSAPKALAANAFGICSGIRPDGTPSSAPPALTDWMHDLIGRASGTDLLTFGDLWEGTQGPRDMDLSMITTCLTLGRPYRLPFKEEDGFYFDPVELRRFFPEDVVVHMETHAGGTALQGKLPLPAGDKLPVVFAARLSLSFPLLLSTIPLYRISEDLGFTYCHFSDGGICSNFPIHFFDSPLPRWPTFGINLAGPIVDGVDVWMPDTNQGSLPRPSRTVDNVTAFGTSIRGAMQNWHDNAHIEMPGYRDRIAHIRFDEGEGGLNLNMPPRLIERLGERGERAGRKLVARFAGIDPVGDEPTELDWNNHRRIRTRVALAALEELVLQFAVGYTGSDEVAVAPRRFLRHMPMQGERTYEQLIAEVVDREDMRTSMTPSATSQPRSSFCSSRLQRAGHYGGDVISSLGSRPRSEWAARSRRWTCASCRRSEHDHTTSHLHQREGRRNAADQSRVVRLPHERGDERSVDREAHRCALRGDASGPQGSHVGHRRGTFAEELGPRRKALACR